MITLDQLNKEIKGEIELGKFKMPIREVVEVGDVYKVVGFGYKTCDNGFSFPILNIVGKNCDKYFEFPLSPILRSKGNFVIATIKNKDVELFNSEFRVNAIELVESRVKYPYKVYTLELVNYE